MNAFDAELGVSRAWGFTEKQIMRDVAMFKRFAALNPQNRPVSESAEIHYILAHVSGGNLHGKKILDMGSGNSLYALFLQKKFGAQAIAIDTNRGLLTEAAKKGLKKCS